MTHSRLKTHVKRITAAKLLTLEILKNIDESFSHLDTDTMITYLNIIDVLNNFIHDDNFKRYSEADLLVNININRQILHVIKQITGRQLPTYFTEETTDTFNLLLNDLLQLKHSLTKNIRVEPKNTSPQKEVIATKSLQTFSLCKSWINIPDKNDSSLSNTNALIKPSHTSF